MQLGHGCVGVRVGRWSGWEGRGREEEEEGKPGWWEVRPWGPRMDHMGSTKWGWMRWEPVEVLGQGVTCWLTCYEWRKGSTHSQQPWVWGSHGVQVAAVVIYGSPQRASHCLSPKPTCWPTVRAHLLECMRLTCWQEHQLPLPLL